MNGLSGHHARNQETEKNETGGREREKREGEKGVLQLEGK